MYAITFTLDKDTLQSLSIKENPLPEIARTLKFYGFNKQQGTTFYANEKINAVSCVLIAQELAKLYPWFASAVRDFQMLRIEETNSLMPAIEYITSQATNKNINIA